MSEIKIFKASAGSGKTFRLVVEYLKLLIKNPTNYKHILAVTFTNKATTEMKERILRDLFSLSRQENKQLLQLLMNECRVSAQDVELNSKRALSLILHDYDRFAVSTIDSFFQGILRSFARESGLYGSYEIDLDMDAVLAEACDRMLMSIDKDTELREWLTQMAENRLQEEKGWQIKDTILSVGKELTKSVFVDYRLHQGSLTEERENIKELKKTLQTIKKQYEAECRGVGKEGLALMEKHNLSFDDFKYKGTSFPKMFEKLANFKGGELKMAKRFEDAPDNVESWYGDKKNTSRIDAIYHDGMNQLVKEFLDYYEKNWTRYLTAKAIYSNIFTLGVLSTLSQFVREVGQENNSLLLSESDNLLRGIIAGNDAPFIYEKAGNYYHFFMIDEFQDTSIVQWDNFKPLITNSLAENNPNLVVGDVKQSIYRWRNSDWKLLNSNIKDDLKNYTLSEENLNSNWRSRTNIVEFNNWFFPISAAFLQDAYNQANISSNLYQSTIIDVYADVQQIAASKKSGGIVQCELIDEEKQPDYYSATTDRLISQIEKLQDAGVRASEMAILVKKNNQAMVVVDALLNYQKNNPLKPYNFQVVSDDSLILAVALSVRFIVSMFRFVTSPDDVVNRANIVFLFHHYILPQLQKENILTVDNVENSGFSGKLISEDIALTYFPFFNNNESKVIARHWASLSITDLTAELIARYSLDKLPGEQASLQAFHDVVIDFSKKEGGNLAKFLEWWELKGSSLKVQTAVDRDAIRIMTIHKSKGLEFPYVFLPFCDWTFDVSAKSGTNLIWCKPVDDLGEKFPLLPLSYSKVLGETYFASDYYTELLMYYIDNLNLLYVAFTRAVDGLFIFSKANQKNSLDVAKLLTSTFSTDNASSLLRPLTESAFSYGTLECEKRETNPVNEINLSGKIDVKLNLSNSLKLHKNYDNFLEESEEKMSEKVNEGTLMHSILSLIETSGDISLAVKQLVIEGKINVGESSFFVEKITALLLNEQVKCWFDGSLKILNETTIISPDFNLKRPDRVMLGNDFAIVVDYKTTSLVSESHRKQVLGYLKKIRQMGIGKVEGYVWYLNSNQLVYVSEN